MRLFIKKRIVNSYLQAEVSGFLLTPQNNISCPVGAKLQIAHFLRLHPLYRLKENPCNFHTNIVQLYVQICSVGLMDRISAS